MPARFGWIFGAALLAASATTVWSASIRLPDGPGVNLVYAKCQTCHDLQYVVDGKGLLPAQWRAVIASMHDYGLTASEQENAQILQYLTAYLGSGAPPATAKLPKAGTAAVGGRAVYQQNCAGCHGPEGRGEPGYFPPLAGNSDLSQDRLLPVLVILHGMSGAIKVDGRAYDGSMPPFDHLSDAEVAAAANFVRDIQAGGVDKTSPNFITPETVAKQRERSMTPSQVRAYRSQTVR